MRKSVISILVLLLFSTVLLTMPVSAQSNMRTVTLEDGSEINVETVALNDIPNNITPVYAENREEADRMAAEFFSSLSNNTSKPILPRASSGTAVADSRAFGIGGSITLYVSYQVSGRTITYASPYSQASGFAIGVSYTENSAGGYVTSSGKDYYAYSSGTIGYYIIFEGIGQFYSETCNLSGYVFLVP